MLKICIAVKDQIAGRKIVEKGLAPGDVVVVDGTQKLKSGTPVHAQPLVAAAAGPRAS